VWNERAVVHIVRILVHNDEIEAHGELELVLGPALVLEGASVRRLLVLDECRRERTPCRAPLGQVLSGLRVGEEERTRLECHTNVRRCHGAAERRGKRDDLVHLQAFEALPPWLVYGCGHRLDVSQRSNGTNQAPH